MRPETQVAIVVAGLTVAVAMFVFFLNPTIETSPDSIYLTIKYRPQRCLCLRFFWVGVEPSRGFN